jgi:uncharacterized protein (DUF2126 family)
MLLPSALWADLEAVLVELAADGLALDPAPFREIWDWRFPPLLRWQEGEAVLEVHPALEPWPLICDFPREGGFTSRFVDGSLRRFEITANAAFRQQWRLGLSGRPLELPANGALAVRYRLQRLYPCLHPSIAPHLPLVLTLHGDGAGRAFLLNQEGTAFVAKTAAAAAQLEGQPWRGRRRDGDTTIDLRLG